MAQFIVFPGATIAVTAPGCTPIPIMRNPSILYGQDVTDVTSCLQFTKEELQTIIDQDGCIYFTFINSQPIIRISTTLPDYTPQQYTMQQVAQLMIDEPDGAFKLDQPTVDNPLYKLYLTNLRFDLTKDQYRELMEAYDSLLDMPG